MIEMAEPLNMILIDNNKVTSYNFISGVKLDMEQVIELLERVPSVYSSYEDKKGYGVEQFSVRQLFNMYVSRDTKVVRFFDTMDDVVVIANDGIADIRLHLYYMLQSPGTNPAILGYINVPILTTTIVTCYNICRQKSYRLTFRCIHLFTNIHKFNVTS